MEVRGMLKFMLFGSLAWVGLTGATSAQTVEYIHTDAIGSPVALTDVAGKVVNRTAYEPYGAPIGGIIDNGPGFAGHVSDSSTALDHMQQRYYDPDVGRFLSIDPVQVSMTSGAVFNRYSYAGNSPYTFIDPDGRDAIYFEDVNVLVIPVYFHGSAASSENVGRIKSKIDSLSSDWGGMKVRLHVLNAQGGAGANSMDLSPGNDFRNYPLAGEGVNDFGGNAGHINSSKDGWIGAAAHDILHFAGAPEGYNSIGSREERSSTLKPGYTDEHIMANRNGSRLKSSDTDAMKNNETTYKFNLSSFKGVFRVQGRIDSKKLEKRMSGN